MPIVTAPTSITPEQVERFFRLFPANDRSHGQYVPDSESPAFTVKGPLTLEHATKHLLGEVGMGAVPILDKGTCWWAAIDIDVHGPNGVQVDILVLEAKTRRLDLPLMVCRSKSGGAHLYVFFKEPQDANTVRMVMGRWAQQLGYPGVEIFPKQTSLDAPRGSSERPLGNWINLPYFAADSTNRYCVEGGKQVSLEHFLELAAGRRCTLESYEREAFNDYNDGPPCLQGMIQARIDEGGRNNALFQAAIFLKRAFPDDWRPRLDVFNRLAIVTPVAPRELRQVGGSVAKRDYFYKCREEPCRTHCNKEVCATRRFGINDRDEQANGVPAIDKIEKIIGTPVTWRLTVQGKRVELTTEGLFTYERVRQAVFEQLHIVMPPLKKQDWELYLREMAPRIEEIAGMTIGDAIGQRMVEFCRRVRADRNDPEEMRRDALKRGMPALIEVKKDSGRRWYFAFKLYDFIEYLKRRRALIVPEYQVAQLLENCGLPVEKKGKLKAGGTLVTNVWCVPAEVVEEEKVPELQTVAEY